MSHSYQVRLKNQSGSAVAIFDDWSSLTIERQVGFVPTLRLAIDSRDSRIPLFALDGLIEVWRRDEDAGIDWYAEYQGLHRTYELDAHVSGRGLYTSYSRGYLDLIKRRSIRYQAGHARATQNAAGETAIKNYVSQNAAAAATVAAGRLSEGAVAGLTVAVDGGLGVTWKGSRSYRNLLDTIREIGLATSIDFDVYRTSGVLFEFRTFYPTLGTDRRYGVAAVPVIFSLYHANMIEPTLTISRTEEVTSVLVLGQGEESWRATSLRTNTTAIAESPWNTIELDRDARQEPTTAGLQSIGDTALRDSGKQTNMTFQVLQQPASAAYGKDYFLGDWVTARFGDVEVDLKIDKVSINVAEGKEDIRITFKELYS